VLSINIKYRKTKKIIDGVDKLWSVVLSATTGNGTRKNNKKRRKCVKSNNIDYLIY